MFCLRFGHHGSLKLDQLNSVVITYNDMCVNWNELQVSRLQLYEQPSVLLSTTWWMQMESAKVSKRSE